MKRIDRTALLTLAAVALLPTTGAAQARWSLDVRAGAAFPTEDLGAVELDTGLGFEATVGYRLLPHLSAYAGWDWHRFGAGDALATGGELEETGYAAGFRFEHPFAGETGNGPAYRLRAGVTFNHLEVEDDGGDIVADSGHGAGFELGAGVTFPLGDEWRLAPGLRWRTLTRDLEAGSVSEEVTLSYLALEVGLTWWF